MSLASEVRAVMRSPGESRNATQAATSLEAIPEFGFDAAIGSTRQGARIFNRALLH